MPKKRTGAKLGAKAGAKVAPRAGRLAGKAALKAGKSQAKLAKAAMSSREPAPSRFLKYGTFALAGFAIGALLARSKGDSDSSFTGTTGSHAPDPGSPAGQRGETWGSGTPTGTAGGGGSAAHQRPEDPNRTGAEREYSDPASGPLIGEHRRGSVAGVGEAQEEVEQRIRTRIGEDPRTASMPRVNVEVTDGVAELRGPAPSQEAREAAGEIAANVEGVTEVRNLIVVS
ncbi:BON domain-containing protein [Rubrobacter tropicus]|uniref:BON domain-containing protein n=1 Tax=Rubrobacter tropicus TaxID=2653851 RepID=A0A6G8Q895_9ACTN|nr:BON domain-containing protein [Rubrobacter tropicus]QIN82690.1 BON domain-containing protein [Rubrobacter tropicus]